MSEDNSVTVIKTSLPAKRKHDEIVEPKIKLKNLCKQILKKVRCQFCFEQSLSSSIASYPFVNVQKHSQEAGSGGSMRLKQLKSLIDEQAPSVLSEFSSSKDAIAYLKLKVNTKSYLIPFPSSHSFFMVSLVKLKHFYMKISHFFHYRKVKDFIFTDSVIVTSLYSWREVGSLLWRERRLVSYQERSEDKFLLELSLYLHRTSGD